jgi:hypothetical protein
MCDDDCCYTPGRPRAERVEVIRLTWLAGRGTPDSIAREVASYFTLDGTFLAEHDPFPGQDTDPRPRWLPAPLTGDPDGGRRGD